MDQKAYVITQKRLLRGRQILTLEGNILTIQCCRGLSLQEYRFDLRGLLPDPVRFRNMPIVKIVGFTLAGVLGLFLFPFGIIAEVSLNMSKEVGSLSGIGVLLLLIGGFGWSITAKGLANVLIFEGPAGRLVLWSDRPNKKQFSEFVAVLTSRIRNARDQEQVLLRRLRQAGIIDDWQYDQGIELFHEKGERPDDE